MGVTPQRITNWKSGSTPMPEHQFAKLAELVEGEEKARSLLWDFVQQKHRQMKAASVAAVMALITALTGLVAPDQVVAAEHCLHTAGVTGSNPVPPTKRIHRFIRLAAAGARPCRSSTSPIAFASTPSIFMRSPLPGVLPVDTYQVTRRGDRR